MIVPDSIEPYEGWKALRITNLGWLFSPQQGFLWPMKERAEAECEQESYRWAPRKGLPPVRDPRLRVVLQTGFSTAHTSPAIAALPDWGESAEEQTPPATLLPPGMHWSWEPYQHDAASKSDCGCGIYMVDDPKQCNGYLAQDCVLVQLYGWGNVIRGSKGARVQYAYPKLMIVPAQLHERGALAAELYEIPLLEAPTTPRTPLPAVSANQAAAAMKQITTSSQKAQAQMQEAQAMVLKLTKQLEIDDLPPAEMTPLIGGAAAAMIGTVISTVALAFTWGTPNQNLALYPLLGCVFLVLMLLLIDLIVFAQKEKAKKR